MADAKFFHDHWIRCFELAERSQVPEVKARLARLAEQYKLQARHAEEAHMAAIRQTAADGARYA